MNVHASNGVEFGHSLPEEMMIAIMREDTIAEFDKNGFDADMSEKLCAQYTAAHGSINDDVGASIQFGVLMHKVYGLSEEEILSKASDNTLIKFIFDKYVETHPDFMDALIPAGLVGADTFNINIGEQMSITAVGMTDSHKTGMMEGWLQDIMLKMGGDRRIRNIMDMFNKEIKLLRKGDTEMRIQATFGLILIDRFKYDFPTCLKLVKAKTALDTCFEKFMAEFGTGFISTTMGEPPTSSIN